MKVDKHTLYGMSEANEHKVLVRSRFRSEAKGAQVLPINPFGIYGINSDNNLCSSLRSSISYVLIKNLVPATNVS